LPPIGGGVVVDIGTGDGRYVYRSARSDPDRFYIGIDVERRALEKVSEKIHRRPEKGGLSNVLFVHASVEALPAELDRCADEIHIHCPWGSLLHSLMVGDGEVLAGLHRITAPDAWLEVLIGIDEARDEAEIRRLQLPSLTDKYVQSSLVPQYARAGFSVEESGVVPVAQWHHVETTWAKRLHGNDSRRLFYLLART
jgi:16S rRNA (adenine(1408)-N(1))-methyltransferase